MGEVWEAEDLALHRRVAVKLLRPELADSEQALERFQREAEAQGRVQHPGVVTVHSLGCAHEQPFLVLELVPGGWSLADFLADARSEPDSLGADYELEVVRLFVKVLVAMHAAHEVGVVHRDIKPQNILINAQDEPKVGDFGLARLADRAPLTRRGEIAGTFSYMSPEQIEGHSGVDRRRDIFSLGATLYELLTLRRAFEGDTTGQIRRRILMEDPPDARSVRPSVPRALALVCRKALSKRAPDRYPTALAFADDLARYLDGESVVATAPGPLDHARSWLRRHPRVTPILLVGGPALLLVLLLVDRNRVRTLDARNANYDMHLARAEWASDQGDLARAREQVDLAAGILPADPRADLVLAGAYARRGITGEANACLDAAYRKGFTEGAHPSTALEHYAHGLALLRSGQRTGAVAAIEAFGRALEFEDAPKGVLYSLHKAQLLSGRRAAALSALAAYLLRLPTGDAFTTIVEAQLAELQGRPQDARSKLGELARRPDPGVSRALLETMLGRLALDAGDLDEAVVHLELALAESATSCGAWSNLAVAHARLALTGGSEHCDAADRNAARALECLPDNLQALEARVSVALIRLDRHSPIGKHRRAGLVPLSERIQELSVAAPDHPQLDDFKSLERFWFAYVDYEAERHRAAVSGFRAALELDEENARARILLGESHWWLGEFEAAHTELSRARVTWARREKPGTLSTHWGLVIEVWDYSAACRLGNIEAARRARAAAEVQLTDERTHDPVELLNFAEFLATEAIDELRNCPRALELLDLPVVSALLDDERFGAQARAIADSIADACP